MSLSIGHVAFFVLGIVALVFLVRGVVCAAKRRQYKKLQKELRDKFEEAYGIALRNDVSIKARNELGEGYFFFSVPRWEFANSDGSRDRRRKENRIKSGAGTLAVGCFTVESSDPAQIVQLANTLRRNGVRIKKNPMEEVKQNRIAREALRMRKMQTIDAIVGRFSSEPTKFEEWCADLLCRDGYHAVVTPPSRDGGYDIEFVDRDGRKGIAECKCFNPDHKVGRPLIQKLVGANASKKASRLLFMTTSSFTPDACQYARETDVELLDGSALVGLEKRAPLVAPDVSSQSWMLSWEDLAKMYPPDCPPSYFGF